MNLVIKSLVRAVPNNRSVGVGKGKGETVHFRVFHSQHILFLNLPLKINIDGCNKQPNNFFKFENLMPKIFARTRILAWSWRL